MAEVKWIKIVTDIFDDEKILLIESMPEADSIIVIWLKLLCLAGKQNNNGVFIMNDKIPYTDQMLATIFRRKEITIKMALQTFERFGMIEIINDVITIPNWGKHQSLEKLEAKREYDRNYQKMKREQAKTMIENRTTVVTMSNDNRSIDIEEDKEKDKSKKFKRPTLEDLTAYIKENGYQVDPQRFMDYYESNGWKVGGKAPMKNWQACVRTWNSKEKPTKRFDGSEMQVEEVNIESLRKKMFGGK